MSHSKLDNEILRKAFVLMAKWIDDKDFCDKCPIAIGPSAYCKDGCEKTISTYFIRRAKEGLK